MVISICALGMLRISSILWSREMVLQLGLVPSGVLSCDIKQCRIPEFIATVAKDSLAWKAFHNGIDR